MSCPGIGARCGTTFGSYELQSLIGIGGMGEVYRAYDTVRERTVALKLLRTDVAADPVFVARFRRESRLAARLQAPNVIPVHDFGEIDGVLFIDMRLVEGPSVRELLQTERVLPPERVVTIIGQIAAALDAAHASGLVHRDVKPENVLLTVGDFAYLVDFGIAHGGDEASVTKTDLIVGSCAYMATERLGGEPGGPRSDVYSLACLLYECLTGRAPFQAADLRQLMSAHMFSPPPRPTAVRADIGPAFDEVIARGMAKYPADRYATAGQLAHAAAAALQSWSAPARTPRFTRTRQTLLLATVGTFALAGLLAAVIVFSGGGSRAPQTPLASAPPARPPETATVTTTAPPDLPRSVAGMTDTDGQGFVGHAARCDDGSTPSAAIRTASSLAVICQTASGGHYYHGERLSDGANVKIFDAVPTGDGYDAVNPADGVRYEVRPDRLTILSYGRVDSSEPPMEYGAD